DGGGMRIAGEIMHRTGLSRYGEEDDGVRWVAVHHGDNHIHIVATLARQDGRKAKLDNDYFRVGEAVRDIEAEYGLVVTARADRTAAPGPVRAGGDRESRPGRPGPGRPGSPCAAMSRPRRPGPGPSRSFSPPWSGAVSGSG